MAEMSVELLAALINDDAKAARLKELTDQEKKNAAILAEAQAARDAAGDQLEEARKALVNAKAVEDSAAERHRQLDAREKGLGEAITTYNSDRKSFNEIRAQIEADLKRRQELLVYAEASNKRLSEELMDREMKLALEEQNVKDLKASLETKHARLHQALAENEAEEEPAADA